MRCAGIPGHLATRQHERRAQIVPVRVVRVGFDEPDVALIVVFDSGLREREPVERPGIRDHGQRPVKRQTSSRLDLFGRFRPRGAHAAEDNSRT